MTVRKVALAPLQAEWRARIDQGMLLTRLHGHAKGAVEMTPTQISAAKILLAKCLPDLSSVEMTGAGGGPLTITINKL